MHGYGRFSIDGRLVAAHRFAFEQKHGVKLGEAVLDHICENPSCVNPEHLRVATVKQNSGRMRKERTQGPYRGVKLTKRSRNSWQAAIRRDGKSVYLGSFRSPEDAARAYDAAAIEEFGEFARLNFPAVRALDSKETT
jgi:hypothetical protein